MKGDLWSTIGTSERLGVETPVKRIVVLRAAMWAELRSQPSMCLAGHREAPR